MSDENDSYSVTIARSVSFIALMHSDKTEAGLAEQGAFLERLGLSRKDAAIVLGTTDRSLTELMRQNRNKKAKKGAAK